MVGPRAIKAQNSSFELRIFLVSAFSSTWKLPASASMQAYLVKPSTRSCWHMRDILIFNQVENDIRFSFSSNELYLLLVFVFKLKASNEVFWGEEFNLSNLG